MLKELIANIKENSKLSIKNINYEVLSKVFYVTEEDKETEYVKMKLSNHKFLVVIPNDDFLYIGEIDNNLNNLELDSIINYKDKMYCKVTEGFQLVKRIEFGKDIDIEKECRFTDYESEDNETIISFGTLANNEPANIFALVLNSDDVQIIVDK